MLRKSLVNVAVQKCPGSDLVNQDVSAATHTS